MTSELRRAIRYPIVATVEVRQRQSRVRVLARTSDLSITGCYVDTLNPLPCGTDIELRISHDGAIVTIDGTVAYAKPNMGMGVQFKFVEEHQLKIVLGWIAGVVPLS